MNRQSYRKTDGKEAIDKPHEQNHEKEAKTGAEACLVPPSPAGSTLRFG
jgi:hypothetical protein